jgi:hypothetical protein
VKRPGKWLRLLWLRFQSLQHSRDRGSAGNIILYRYLYNLPQTACFGSHSHSHHEAISAMYCDIEPPLPRSRSWRCRTLCGDWQ